MPDRAAARLAWTRQVLDAPHVELEPASSDASFRSYWRTRGVTPTRIVMDAPPAQEDLAPWLAIVDRLSEAGLHAPHVFARDLAQGFLLLADLGREPLLAALNEASVDALYARALDALLAMQTRVDARDLPAYDDSRLQAEMALLPTWFLHRHLGHVPSRSETALLDTAFRALADNALQQPQVFVHRDYHSRNLLLDDTQLGIIDFQDAVRGPITYDLVSLLRDCYIEWPEARVQGWAESYRQRVVAAGLTDADGACFRRWFDLMGLQRHIKVLGIFCRLWYRDGKRGYLADLPRVWRYTRDVGRRHEETRALIDWLDAVIADRDLTEAADGAS